MIIGNRTFSDKGKVYVMGILNVTPDSFSDGGCYNNVDAALIQTEKMIKDGTDIIDIGGESTRPGYDPIGDDEELKRLVPIITAIRRNFNIPVSVDTYHSHVAKEAAFAGADMINDIWGLKFKNNSESMAKVVKDTGVSICIMHNSESVINDLVSVDRGLIESIGLAKKAGIPDERIMIDPGVGFAKDYNMNMAVTANLERFNELGYPVLLGASRKSLIGLTLDQPVDERLEGTLVTSVFAVLAGCSYVRVHDVKSNLRAIKMAEALMNYR